jgi:hypothetical protein
MEVAPLVVGVEELTRSLSEDAKVVRLTQELKLGVGEALGLSLLEVQAWYFRDTDKSSYLVEEWTFADVINNHNHVGRYAYEDLDGIPFSAYGSHA